MGPVLCRPWPPVHSASSCSQPYHSPVSSRTCPALALLCSCSPLWIFKWAIPCFFLPLYRCHPERPSLTLFISYITLLEYSPSFPLALFFFMMLITTGHLHYIQSMEHKCQFSCCRASCLLSITVKEKKTNQRPFKVGSSDGFLSSPLDSFARRVPTMHQGKEKSPLNKVAKLAFSSA